MSYPKRTLFLILVLGLFALSSSYGQENSKLDSLINLSSQYKGSKLVDLFIEIAKLQGISDHDLAHQSADEAILLANQINYQKGVGLAYLAKGTICNLNNHPLTALENFEKAKNIFLATEDRENLASVMMGIGDSFTQQGLFDEAEKATNEAIQYYDYVGNYKALAEAYYQNGTNFNMVGKYKKAQENFSSSATYYNKINDEMGAAKATNSLGVVYYNTADYKNAFLVWTEYEQMMRKMKNWHRVAASLNNKGLVYISWGAYDEALEAFTNALELEEKSNHTELIAGLYNTMGTVFHYSGNIDKSFEYYRKSVRYGKETNNKETVSIGMHNIGELFLDIGQPDSALYYVQRSLQIENTLFNKIGIAETKATMGKVYLRLKKYHIAFSYLDQAAEVFLEAGHLQGLADVYQKYGYAYSDIGNDTLSIDYLNKSNEIAKEIDLKKTQFENHKYLSSLFEKKRDFKNALFHYKLFQEINDSIFNQMTLDKTAYLTIKLENGEKEKEMASLQHEQEVNVYKSQMKDYVSYFAALVLIILVISFYFRYAANKRSTIRLNDQYQVLLESEEKIRALLDASHDIVLLIDRAGVIVSANSRAESALRNGNQLVGYDFKEVVLPMFQDQFTTQIARVLKQKKSHGFSSLSSSKRTYDVTISPIFKDGIEVTGLAIYMQDITDITIARNEKKKLEDQLFQVQKLESVGTMAGGVAHDFNNFLGTILGYSSMGSDDALEDTKAKRYFQNITAAAKSAQHTVQKILTFSRTNVKNKLTRVNLVDVAKESILMVNSTKPSDLEIKLTFTNKKIEILGNNVEFQQVFINLFNNAFHASEGMGRGEIECSISNTVFEESHHQYIEKIKTRSIAGICVKDNGIGMSEQILKRIFEPFFTTKDVGSGTGLGLSVVHGIIKNHKGEMHVDSTAGVGSRFYIYLPAIS